jgi:hypothetical protein
MGEQGWSLELRQGGRRAKALNYDSGEIGMKP